MKRGERERAFFFPLFCMLFLLLLRLGGGGWGHDVSGWVGARFKFKEDE